MIRLIVIALALLAGCSAILAAPAVPVLPAVPSPPKHVKRSTARVVPIPPTPRRAPANRAISNTGGAKAKAVPTPAQTLAMPLETAKPVQVESGSKAVTILVLEPVKAVEIYVFTVTGFSEIKKGVGLEDSEFVCFLEGAPLFNQHEQSAKAELLLHGRDICLAVRQAASPGKRFVGLVLTREIKGASPVLNLLTITSQLKNPLAASP